MKKGVNKKNYILLVYNDEIFNDTIVYVRFY